MAATSVEADPQLTAFTLPGTPESVPVARCRIRAALSSHQLGEYADEAEAITSELVTNAIQHACADGKETVGVTLVHIRNPETVTVIVTDPSPQAPVRREPSHGSEQGRGLLIVDELSARWGWGLADDGKAVYAILAEEAAR